MVPSSFVWADVLTAAQEKPWIHGVTTYIGGEQTASSEFWVSPTRQIAAAKFGELAFLEDFAQQVTWKYQAGETTVYRLPREKMPTQQQSLELFMSNPAKAADAFYGEDIKKTERREVEEGGVRWVDYLVHLVRIDNPTLHRTLRLRVNSETKLLDSMEERQSSGLIAQTRFDYPDDGPSDVYSLGAPPTATLVDRAPRGDLARIVALHKSDRRRFDDYDAIVVTYTNGMTTNYAQHPMNLQIARVRRNGDRYRVDQLIGPKLGISAPANDTDMSVWWRQNRENYWSVPLLICDGKRMVFYRMLDDRLDPVREPNLTVLKHSERPLRLPLEDSPVEWPHLMPEQLCRPHLWAVDENRKLVVDESQTDGPEGMVCVVVAKERGKPSGELHRYWFDPDHGYVLGKAVSAVFDRKTEEVAYLDTEVFEDLAESPSGRWFPQRVVRTTSNNEQWSSVTNFYVNFDVTLPDVLFQPLQGK